MRLAALLTLLLPIAALAQVSESGQLFKGRDATIYYEQRGSGNDLPLMVINGGPGVDHRYLHSTLRKISALDLIARGRPVVFYDQRGVGRSPALAAGETCTVADQVEDLDALRAHLGYERIDLFGHSFGGYLAMAYAARHPEHIAHLILSDSEAPRATDTVFLFDKIYPETNTRMESRQLADPEQSRAYLMDYFSMIFYAPAKRDAYLATVHEPERNTEISDTLWKDMEQLDYRPEIAKFRFPTLVMTGRFDINIAPSVAYQIHQAIPDSRFVVFDTSGHMPFYEEQEKFVKVMETFLADH